MRERGLKVALVIIGLACTAGSIPVIGTLWHHDTNGYTDAMMLSIYTVLGLFLLMAVRDPAAHRSLIAFAGWANLAHAGVMLIMVVRDVSERELLPGVFLFGIAGIILVLLTPKKKAGGASSAAAA